MNTVSRTNEESDIQQLVPRGPGEVLRHARERHRISLEEASQFLHLPRDVIEALESDQQDLLPEPTYVKGYIRSYARYLELDSEPLIESYMKYVYVPPAPPLQAPQSKKAPQSKAQRGPLDIALIALLSCVFVFLSVWWFYPQPTKFISEISAMVSGRFTDVTESTTSPGTASMHAERKFEDAPQLDRQTVMANSEVSSNTIDGSTAEAISDMATASRTSVLIESPKIDESDETVNTEAKATAAQSTTASAEEEGFEIQGRVAPGGDKLTLSFSDHSWTEVYDANKERLLFGLVNSGSVKELQGQAPFRILLGNSSAVTIKFNGEPYDHSEFERFDKTARFLVQNSTAN